MENSSMVQKKVRAMDKKEMKARKKELKNLISRNQFALNQKFYSHGISPDNLNPLLNETWLLRHEDTLIRYYLKINK